MASFELVSLSSSDVEDFDDDTNELLRARHAREDHAALLIMKILANTFQKRTMSRSRSMRCPNAPTGVHI